MATNTTNYNFVKQDENEFYDINIVNQNLDGIDNVLSQYEFQTPTISGTQIRLTKQSNANRLFFKLESELSGNITVSIDGGATSKNLVDVEGVQVTSLDKGFHEVVAAANFFIIRNKGGLSKVDLEALITIVNEAEANESVLRTEYINTVNAADESITLPSTATWNDILLQLPNINASNKRWATGSKTTTPYGNISFSKFDGTTFSCGGISVTGLTFKPSLIIAANESASGVNMVIVLPEIISNPTNTTQTARVLVIQNTLYSSPVFNKIKDGGSLVITDSGFTIPSAESGNTSGSTTYTYNWLAIE